MWGNAIVIQCDVPYCETKTYAYTTEISEARFSLKIHGWVYENGKDYCPKHGKNGGDA